MRNLSENIMKNLKESSNKRKLKEDDDLSKQLDDEVIDAKEEEIFNALNEYFTEAGYKVKGVKNGHMGLFVVKILCDYRIGEVNLIINTLFREFEFVAIELLDTTYSTYLTSTRIKELSKLAKAASNINSSLNLLDIIK